MYLRSLRLKIVMSVIPLVALGITALAVTAIRSATDAQRGAVLARLQQQTRSSAAEQETAMCRRADVAENLAALVSHYAPADRAEATAMLLGLRAPKS